MKTILLAVLLLAAAPANPASTAATEGGSAWLTFEGFIINGGTITAKVRVLPTFECPPTPPPAYGSMEVWIAPYQGISKTSISHGYWTLGPLASDSHYRVFAWFTDTCGVQHTSDEIAFDTPPWSGQ